MIGYGNSLRRDDGLGWHVAERLADDPRLHGVTVLRCHQLTPELALDISSATLVVLVDASLGPPAGTFTVSHVERIDGSATTWSHRLSPASLVSMAEELYGRAPDVFVISGGVQSLDVGDQLSPVVEASLPLVVDAVVGLVAGHAADPTADEVAGIGDA